MKTKITITEKRNFFQKTFILLAILAFTSFGFKAKAQNQIDYDVNNQGGCDVTVKAYDFWGLQLYSISCLSGFLTNSTCFNKSTTVYRIAIIRPGCTTVSFYATSSTSGVITYSSVSASCSSPCTYSTMTCAGSGGGTSGGGPNDFHYLIELL